MELTEYIAKNHNYYIVNNNTVNDKNSIKNKNNSYYQKMLLNLGLERLIEFYLKKNKKSS